MDQRVPGGPTPFDREAPGLSPPFAVPTGFRIPFSEPRRRPASGRNCLPVNDDRETQHGREEAESNDRGDRPLLPGRAGGRVPARPLDGQLARLLGRSVKTVYERIAKGRLDGAFRKRERNHLIWRDRAIGLIFNGKEWR